MAKLIQGFGHSEFLVGIKSHEFGDIDIRTSVVRHEFTAQISVEHNDMAKTLVSELPSLYGRLGDQKVPVANIQIQNQGLDTSSGFARNAQPQATARPSRGTGGSSPELEVPSVSEVSGMSGRLDIRI
jgi:flagellar hook-length control protein FliK